MQCHTVSPQTAALSQGEVVILVGNPNVGKSVVFAHLTGRYVDVSNYPGTTVEVTRGRISIDGAEITVIDTPGINSLLPRSEDERVTHHLLLNEKPRAVIQVADAKNLRRALLLTAQFAEMEIPLILVLNMQDEAQARGIQVDAAALSRSLAIDVIPAVATRGDGLDVLKGAIAQARAPQFPIAYSHPIMEALTDIELLLGDIVGKRALASTVLDSDELPGAVPAEVRAEVEAIRCELKRLYDVPLSYIINQERLHAVDRLVESVYQKQQSRRTSLAEQFGRLATHPIWGWPILLIVLFAMYQFVGVFGAGMLVGTLENVVFGEWINPMVASLVERVLPIPLIKDFLVGEYGLVPVALSYGFGIVLPIVTTFFIAFGVLEDSGYLPRLAVMVNRPFKAMGLNGKAVLPMVLGLGCDTMATMTTRILETRKERILTTLLLALGVPCSAQLGVILGMVTFISPTAMAIWFAVVAGVMLAVGWIASRLIPGQKSDFIVELPPIRAPRLDNIFFKTIARLEWYLKEVLPLFILGTVLLFVLDSAGALLLIERAASPIIEGLLGLPREATVSFLIGFLRRDYGAAGLFMLAREGALTPTQITISLVVITLFMPCIANLMIIVKEYGWKTAVWVSGVVFPLAFGVGGLLNLAVRVFGLAFR